MTACYVPASVTEYTTKSTIGALRAQGACLVAANVAPPSLRELTALSAKSLVWN